MGRNPSAAAKTRYYQDAGSSSFQFRNHPKTGWAVCYSMDGLAKAKARNWVDYRLPRADYDEQVRNGTFIEYTPEDYDGT